MKYEIIVTDKDFKEVAVTVTTDLLVVPTIMDHYERRGDKLTIWVKCWPTEDEQGHDQQ